MKYTFLLFALLPFIFSCKSKKAIVQNKIVAPAADTAYVENPDTGELTMIITNKNQTPSGTWALQMINHNEDPEVRRISMKLEFSKKENKVSGNDGCNQYSGIFDTDDSKAIEFGPLASTERACIVPAPFANEFYSSLQTVVSYINTGKNLIFKNSSGDTVMQFEKKD